MLCVIQYTQIIIISTCNLLKIITAVFYRPFHHPSKSSKSGVCFTLKRCSSSCHAGWRGARGETEAQDRGGGQGTGEGELTRQMTATSGAPAKAEADSGR